MSRTLIARAVENVRQLVCPVDGLCEVCRNHPSAIPPDHEIDVKGIMTPLGVSVCRNCFENIEIQVGLLSDEF